MLKRFWSKSHDSTAVAAPPEPKVEPRRGAVPPQRPPSPAAARPAANGTQAAPHANGASTPRRASQPGFVDITLGAIEPSLPEPLRHKIAGALQETVRVPIDKVVPQLRLGSVTMTVSDLRSYAPELLASLAGHDELPVTLPLSEIVGQLDKNCFQRGQQTRIQVPAAVPAVFLQSGGTTSAAAGAAEAPKAPIRATVTNTTTTPTAAPATAQAQQTKLNLSPQALAALAAKKNGTHEPARPSAIAAPVPSGPAPRPQPQHQAAPQPQAQPQAQPQPRPQPSAPTVQATSIPAPNLPPPSSLAPTPAPTPAPASQPVFPPRSTTPAPSAASSARPLAPIAATTKAPAKDEQLPVPLQRVFDELPDEVRRELADVDVPKSTLMLPLEGVKALLKSGKVLFTWADLAATLQPPLPRPPSKSAGDLLVELPLKTIAPIFMAHHRAATAPKKPEVDANIPDLFQGGSTGEASSLVPGSGPAALAQANGGTAPRSTQPASAAATHNGVVLPAIEELLGQEAKRLAPKQVLQNISRLPGVTGAVIAMADGLPVATTIPGTIKGDNVAAFLPQMFGRMSQYTKELGMGPLQSMTLNVDGSSWLVIKQPNIYFAVCGKPGEAMPFNLLAQVAAEMSKQSM